jgi:hypothetical protein
VPRKVFRMLHRFRFCVGASAVGRLLKSEEWRR